jgi:catechol 2,3-dioxygenase-like lactoylglutathione lyase family enzyme
VIDHIGIEVTDLARSIAFYERALAPLGYTLIQQYEGFAAGFGQGGKADFWIGTGKGGGSITARAHIAFHAARRSTVKAFYDAAIAAGGKDNGPPGTRPIYHEHYYGAFVHDPDGHNVEAVCHDAYLG